jgi:membrane associated rhomboid family serine protease
MVPGELTGKAAVGVGVPIGNGLACVVDRAPVNWLTPLTSMFLHGGWMHLLGNALFFWVFGNNIEDSMGPGRFVVFYLLCGLIAGFTHVIMDPTSPIPTVGASGAIAGILGAYLVLYPKVRVNMLFFFVIFFRIIPIPAWVVLIYWFLVQLISGWSQLTPLRPEVSTGVAFWAHIGGFLAGVALIKLFEDRRRVAARTRREVISGPQWTLGGRT